MYIDRTTITKFSFQYRLINFESTQEKLLNRPLQIYLKSKENFAKSFRAWIISSILTTATTIRRVCILQKTRRYRPRMYSSTFTPRCNSSAYIQWRSVNATSTVDVCFTYVKVYEFWRIYVMWMKFWEWDFLKKKKMSHLLHWSSINVFFSHLYRESIYYKIWIV